MIKIEFSDEDKAALSYERYNHPHPFVQRKMEALWLKSQGLAHKDIRRLTNVCSTTLTDYVRDYYNTKAPGSKVSWRTSQGSLECAETSLAWAATEWIRACEEPYPGACLR